MKDKYETQQFEPETEKEINHYLRVCSGIQNNTYFADSMQKGIRKMLLVHRLVAKTFIGNLPDDKQVNHIDFNPSNNTVDNLEICTPVENMVHYYKKNKDEKIKLTYQQIKEIISLVRDSNKSQVSVAKMFGIYQADVSNYLSGKRRKYVY